MVCPPDLADCGRHRIKHWEEKWPRGQQEFLADPVRRQRAQVRWRERMALRNSVRESVLPMLEFRGVPEAWRPMYQDAAWRLARLAERHIGFQLASEAKSSSRWLSPEGWTGPCWSRSRAWCWALRPGSSSYRRSRERGPWASDFRTCDFRTCFVLLPFDIGLSDLLTLR
jgi:hypothetical protein